MNISGFSSPAGSDTCRAIHTCCSWLAEVRLEFFFPGDKQANGRDPEWIKNVTGLTIWWWRESWSFPREPIVPEMFQNLDLDSDQSYSVQPILSWNSGSLCLERFVGGVPVQLLCLPWCWRWGCIPWGQQMLSASWWLSDTVTEISPADKLCCPGKSQRGCPAWTTQGEDTRNRVIQTRARTRANPAVCSTAVNTDRASSGPCTSPRHSYIPVLLLAVLWQISSRACILFWRLSSLGTPEA